MTLTVRLDAALEAALERHCAEQGLTKSVVVQQSLAGYLIESRASAPAASAAAGRTSANYRAFADAGLIGTGELGGRSADKAAVRERAMQRIGRRSAR